MFREQCRIQRHEYEAKILWEINEFKLKTENILKEHWECLLTKPKSIHVIRVNTLWYNTKYDSFNYLKFYFSV